MKTEMSPSSISSSLSSSSNSCWRHLYYATVLLLFASSSSSYLTSEAFVIVSPAASPPSSSAKAAAKIAPLFATPNNYNNDVNENAPLLPNHQTTAPKKPQLLTHADITWKLRPPENTSKLSRLQIKFGANLLRLYSKLKGKTLPPVLCPKGGRAMLEAYYKEPGWFQRERRIGRFGFTTLRGPSNNEIDATIRQVYKINPPPLSATIAAIIYMFVEPNYRHRNVGSLALDVISAVQSVQAVDFTVLVAAGDDTLVEWYERNGYTKAPLLQEVMGSPDGKFGVTMIAPVGVTEGFFDECNLRWW